MVQNHTSYDQVDLLVRYWQIPQVAQAKLATHRFFTDRLARHIEHRRRRVDGDHALDPLEQIRQQQTRARAHIQRFFSVLGQEVQRYLAIDVAIKTVRLQFAGILNAVKESAGLFPAALNDGF